MNSYDEEELVLGADVTELAKAKGQGGTAVVSLRLTRHEYAEIEAISAAQEKSLSDVVRAAIRAYVQQRTTVPLVPVGTGRNFVMPGVQWSAGLTGGPEQEQDADFIGRNQYTPDLQRV